MEDNWIVWNVRGLNNPARRTVVKVLVYRNNVSLVCLQETKLSFIYRVVVNQCCGTEFSTFAYLTAEGSRGGVLLAWKGDHYTVSNVTVQGCLVTAAGNNAKGGASGNYRSVWATRLGRETCIPT
ncbi:hypothetical protein CFC21_104857 [Triticum aestivum]|uniref:Uncharacterized protein n=2 Tax=Triticum aestivum TaxID=4565 RepID=A0A9R1FJE7_WHEAT|nr:hypothetical protein CFC21_041573 [Triticum aestivum]KAF7103926.1 hypothetical protein CFC21_104857 [Triticum aestivum]